jgi:AraC-like DNA-binding protein
MHCTPLQAFQVLDTADPCAARATLIGTYGARTFEVRKNDAFNVRASFVQVGGISLSYCDYASYVSLSFPEASFVRQHICLSGEVRIHSGGHVQELTSDEWSGLIPPLMDVRYEYGAGTKQLVMWLDLQKLGSKLDALLGDGRERSLDWSAGDGARPMAMASMRRAVEFLAVELEANAIAAAPKLGFVEIEDYIMVRFLYAHDHEQLLRLTREVRSASNAQLKRLEDYIFENWYEPIDVETMANVSGVSARSVFRHFRAVHGCTPQAFRKRIRLDRARERLLKNGPGTTVVGVALSCGFQSLGHFAREYRQTFGELPSSTLTSAARV